MNSTASFYLRAAPSHLDAARFCHDGKHFGVAIAEAYHSIFASVKVRPRKRGEEPPDRHFRSLSLLYHEFLEEGTVVRDVSRFVPEVQTYRDDWTYEANLPDAPRETAAEAIEGASLLKRIVNPNSSGREIV